MYNMPTIFAITCQISLFVCTDRIEWVHCRATIRGTRKSNLSEKKNVYVRNFWKGERERIDGLVGQLELGRSGRYYGAKFSDKRGHLRPTKFATYT
jgi:hypothetical protein